VKVKEEEVIDYIKPPVLAEEMVPTRDRPRSKKRTSALPG
jgi:hypothetical protein